jgi:hypothetical protein
LRLLLLLLALNAIDVRGRLEATAAATLRLLVLAVAWATAHIHGQVLSRMLLRMLRLLLPRVSEQREVVATEDSLIWKESNGNG